MHKIDKPKILELKAELIFNLAQEVFDKGQRVKIIVTGNSMYPFLRHAIDSVELEHASLEDVRKGDIVLIKRDDGVYILHRIVSKKEDCFYMIGDSQDILDGPYFANHLIAVVTAIYRKDHRIESSDKRLKFLSRVWMILKPFRFTIIKIYNKFRQLTSRKKAEG